MTWELFVGALVGGGVAGAFTQYYITRRHRDWLAGLAMQAMTASPELMVIVTAGDLRDGTAFERMAKKAYEQADAMIRIGKNHSVRSTANSL